jgi:hypothetical protein
MGMDQAMKLYRFLMGYILIGIGLVLERIVTWLYIRIFAREMFDEK